MSQAESRPNLGHEPTVYRTFLEVYGERLEGHPEIRRRQVVVVYRGTSRRRAVAAYNDLRRWAGSNPAVASYGWEVLP